MARPIAENKAQSEKILLLCSAKLRNEIESIVVEKQGEGISAMARDFLGREVKQWIKREARSDQEAKEARAERLARKRKSKAEDGQEPNVTLQLRCSPELKGQVKEMMEKRRGEVLSDLLRTFLQNEVDQWKK